MVYTNLRHTFNSPASRDNAFRITPVMQLQLTNWGSKAHGRSCIYIKVNQRVHGAGMHPHAVGYVSRCRLNPLRTQIASRVTYYPEPHVCYQWLRPHWRFLHPRIPVSGMIRGITPCSLHGISLQGFGQIGKEVAGCISCCMEPMSVPRLWTTFADL
jgi:hypothetical protein